MISRPWFTRAQRQEPYVINVDPPQQPRSKQQNDVAAPEPAPAVAENSMPQAAPPLVPSTVEQQQQQQQTDKGAGDSAERRADPAVLATIGLALLGAWTMLRQK